MIFPYMRALPLKSRSKRIESMLESVLIHYIVVILIHFLSTAFLLSIVYTLFSVSVIVNSPYYLTVMLGNHFCFSSGCSDGFLSLFRGYLLQNKDPKEIII